MKDNKVRERIRFKNHQRSLSKDTKRSWVKGNELAKDLREFFYVDVERARSYLAQLDSGVIESVVERAERDVSADAKASLLGFGASGAVSRGVGREEARSLQDLTFVAFEKLALDKKHLVDAPQALHDEHAWDDGQVHELLQEGQIVRMQADMQVLDPRFFEARLERIDQLAEALIALAAEPNVKPNAPKQQRKLAMEKAREEARTALWGGTRPESIQAIAHLVSSLLGDAIAVRFQPCGQQRPELGFGGALIDRRDYIQPEREALFSRYGAVLRNWTCVVQISSVPKKTDGQAMDFPDVDILGPDNGIQRASLEQLAVQLLGVIETTGMAEGPHWPSISVTPLAIYRQVPSEA